MSIKKRGLAILPLEQGRVPHWLFEKMVKLGRGIITIMVEEFGQEGFLQRLSDPVWFQSLGSLLAFDWNASGLTTVLTACLKEAIKGMETDLGIFICGGKGITSRQTPHEIELCCEKVNLSQNLAEKLIYASRMTAKVDSSLIQDNFHLYHHCFIFSQNGSWCVIQQGMNTELRTARRYHWFSQTATGFIEEPHTGIVSHLFPKEVLDLTSKKSDKNREITIQLVLSGFKSLIKDIKILRNRKTSLSKVLSLKYKGTIYTMMRLEDKEFRFHPFLQENFWQSKYLEKILYSICERKPKNYEELLSQEGVGPKTIRALSLIAELIYGAKPSYEDPARYSFAHGGKDGTPFPVDQKTYEETIKIIKKASRKAKLKT